VRGSRNTNKKKLSNYQSNGGFSTIDNRIQQRWPVFNRRSFVEEESPLLTFEMRPLLDPCDRPKINIQTSRGKSGQLFKNLKINDNEIK